LKSIPTPDKHWIVISEPHNGNLNPGEQTQVTVNALPGNLEAGGYFGTLLVTSKAGAPK
jgi:hypothetical protein